MKAFQSVRSEMRESALAVTQLRADAKSAPAARLKRGRAEPDELELEEGGPLQPWMVAAFEGLTSATLTGAPYDLIPCTMNGKPAVIIALARQSRGATHVTPLFLACQPWMKFSDPASETDGEEGGGPDGVEEADTLDLG